ncbi:QcrA and Rieske domain-containing protein [Deinococcus cellulosilyticus]|uniref:Tat pathway signal sequence domain protein n=1 Tax=Deinococcus cellulosilyticus (strain DSM 18568 / NBRC 106333 / KACC 11606 / 5516J-15) TaxID=1223518 RepID=A0A511N1F2_DEIC1|nr:ubiquinol-cytochrome c reductase iron-sulfur subunit [Deinococcus cellulosilyticus]GEM46288.1 Tat pathway signal sequence domain protein [Deinococcus cellulosilyticus NBRC 106333 = KACC 11606]
MKDDWNNEKAQPHWKTDFSVDWDQTSYITRREFTRFLTLSSAALGVGTTLIAVAGMGKRPQEHHVRKELGSVDQIKHGSQMAFKYPDDGLPALLVRHEDGSFSAFSQKCPHLGCHVFYEEHSKKLECPCHEGFFDAKTGEVLAGPPQRGLSRIDLEVQDGKIYAIGGGGE